MFGLLLGFPKRVGGRSEFLVPAKHFVEFVCEVRETKLALPSCSLTSENVSQPQIPQAGRMWVVAEEGAEVFLGEGLPG